MEHLTAKEVAAELRCSKAHVYNLISGHVPGVPALPAIRLGRRVLVRRQTLTAWAAKVECAATAGVIPSPQCQKLTLVDA